MGPITFLSRIPLLSMTKVSGTPVIPKALAARLSGSVYAGRLNPLVLKNDSIAGWPP